MANLIAAALVFLAIHLLISGTRLRDGIVGAIGEKTYLGLFALASLGVISWMCIAFDAADASAENHLLFNAGHFRDLGIPVIFLAFALIVPGVTRRSPTAVGGESATTIDGVLRITRHPFLWGVAVWSGFHTIATGTLASVIFFGTFFVLALTGTRAIDGKMKRKRPHVWQAVSAETSIVPFAAIAAGRNRFVAREYFDWRFGLAVALFVAVLFLHSRMFSLSPFPGGGMPG
jgi:uncharacterized membrane protein